MLCCKKNGIVCGKPPAVQALLTNGVNAW